MTTSQDTREYEELADVFLHLGRELVGQKVPDQVLQIITRRAFEVVPSAEHAAISRGRHGRFETVFSTSDVPPRVDQIQYDLNSGPCVDAVLDDAVYRVGDLSRTPKWAEFGAAAAAEFGIHSMLSVRLFLEDSDLLAGLNLYSSAVDAFDQSDETTAVLLATHGSLALDSAGRRDKIENLERALQTSRRIGMAIGILMALQKLSEHQAFDLLRIASQTTHRKLFDLAEDVIETGVLQVPPPPLKRQRN